ncbi:hypothetical protein [Streptomyces sp. NPDC005125]
MTTADVLEPEEVPPAVVLDAPQDRGRQAGGHVRVDRNLTLLRRVLRVIGRHALDEQALLGREHASGDLGVLAARDGLGLEDRPGMGFHSVVDPLG